MYSLENESEEVGVLVEGRLWRELEVLLLELASLGVLVANNEVELVMGTRVYAL